MGFAIVLILVVIAVIVIAAIVRSQQARSSDAADDNGAAPAGAEAEDRLRPPYREFHVQDRTAHVTFEVPLGPSGADEVLATILVREAVEVTREKQRTDEVLSGLEHVKAYGRREGRDVFVGEVEIAVADDAGVLDAPQLAFGDLDLDTELTASETPSTTSREDRLAPLSEEIQIAARVEAGLRAQGVDPDTMTAGQLVVGLLRLSGYTVTDAGEHASIARRGGSSLYVKVVDHVPGSYPELDESDMRAFIADFTASKAARGWLVTEKFGPFAVYDSERKMPTVRFVTRERLQGVVDRFTVE